MSKANIKKNYPDIDAMFINEIFSSSLFDNIKARFFIKHTPTAETLPYENNDGKKTALSSTPVFNSLGNSSLQVRSSIKGDSITIDGSYIKWLTGQNVIGLEELIFLCYLTFKKVCKQLNLKPTKEELADVKTGKFELISLDYTVHCDAKSRKRTLFLQREIKKVWSTTRSNYAHYKNHQTLYVNKCKYSRWIFKSYLKGLEIKDKGGLNNVLYGSQIESISNSLVRLELTVKRKWMEKYKPSTSEFTSFYDPRAWTQDEARKVMQEKLEDLLSNIGGIYPNSKKLSELNDQKRMIVMASFLGISVVNVYNKRAINRFRTEIKKEINIDIFLPRDIALIGSKLTSSRKLIDNNIRYNSRKELVHEMYKHQFSVNLPITSDISDLMG